MYCLRPQNQGLSGSGTEQRRFRRVQPDKQGNNRDDSARRDPSGKGAVVKSSVDKFYNTELENILRDKGIKTVIIAGTTAEGAVLHTATGASMRGFRVIVPVDGMSAGNLYPEQYTAWHLLNAPGTRRSTTLTRFDMIGF